MRVTPFSDTAEAVIGRWQLSSECVGKVSVTTVRLDVLDAESVAVAIAAVGHPSPIRVSEKADETPFAKVTTRSNDTVGDFTRDFWTEPSSTKKEVTGAGTCHCPNGSPITESPAANVCGYELDSYWDEAES